MIEIWKVIKDYPNYMVSNMGRIKSLERNIVKGRGGGLHKIEEKILKNCKNSCGYLQVSLYKEGKQKRFYIHRLVAQVFLDNPDNLPEVNHKDEDKTNNMVWVNKDGSIDYNKSNLEYCDRTYNINFGTRNERISTPILQFTKDSEFVRRWYCSMDIERELGFKQSNICMCCKGKIKTAYGFVWGYADDYEKIPFNVFDLNIYKKIV